MVADGHPADMVGTHSELRVALYLRVSTEEQTKGHSLDSQRDQLTEWAAREGWQVVSVFEDAGATATEATRRVAFQQMVEAASNHAFDRVLVKNRSRYARSRVDGPAYEALLNKHGVQVWSLEEPASNEDTPAGFLMKGMADLLAAHYSVDLSYKTAQGWRKRAEKGMSVGDAPFGYLRPTSQSALVVDEHSAAAVLHAFERYASGTASMKDIAAELTAAGHTPNSKRGNTAFSKASIERLLANPAYMGHVTYRGEVAVPNAHPAIISPALFDRVTAVRAKRSVGARVHHKTHEYLLTGMAVCFHCGSVLWAAQTNGRYYYRCSAGQRGIECRSGMRAVRAEAIELPAAAFIVGMKLAENWQERLATQSRPVTTIEQVDQRPILEAKLKRLLAMMADGILSFDEGRPQVEDTRAAIAALPSTMPTAAAGDALHGLQAMWPTADPKERRAMLSGLVARVVVDVPAGRINRILLVPEMDSYLTHLDVESVAWRPRSASGLLNGTAIAGTLWDRFPGWINESPD